MDPAMKVSATPAESRQAGWIPLQVRKGWRFEARRHDGSLCSGVGDTLPHSKRRLQIVSPGRSPQDQTSL